MYLRIDQNEKEFFSIALVFQKSILSKDILDRHQNHNNADAFYCLDQEHGFIEYFSHSLKHKHDLL
jgi:hypothetical protein